MSEPGENKPIPIRPDVIVPDANTPTPIRPGIDVPESLGRRNFLHKLAAALGILATGGTAIASQTETGQKIIEASPFTQHPNRRPPVKQQLDEIRQDIRSKNLPNNPTGYDATTLEMMDKIKAANKQNPPTIDQYQRTNPQPESSPTPPQKNSK
jgi:hypothetical protein